MKMSRDTRRINSNIEKNSKLMKKIRRKSRIL